MDSPQEQRRKQAVVRYLAGEKIDATCRDMHCSKSWLYKWRERYLATDPAWSAERSRSPRTTPTKTSQRIEQAVVALRHTLAQHGKGCGAAAIQQALTQQGIEPVPSQRTIYRILHHYAKEVT